MESFKRILSKINSIYIAGKCPASTPNSNLVMGGLRGGQRSLSVEYFKRIRSKINSIYIAGKCS